MYSISQESYIIWFLFIVLMCKMIISPGVFFHYFKILIFWVVKVQKMTQNDKKISHYISQELYLIWLWFLVYMCIMMISPAFFFFFFHFFKILIFQGFSKFINKCQKEILRCSPPFSHVCGFLLISTFKTWFFCFYK